MPSLVYRLESQGFDTLEQRFVSVGNAGDRVMSRITQAVAQMAQSWRQADAQAEQSAAKTAKSADEMAKAFERAAAGAEALGEVDLSGVGDAAEASADRAAGVFEQAVARVKAAFAGGAEESGASWDRFAQRQDRSAVLTVAKWGAVAAAAAYAADAAINGFDKANARVVGIVTGIGEAGEQAARAAEDYARRSAGAIGDAYDQSAAQVQRWADQATAQYQRLSDAAEGAARAAADAAVTKGFELAAEAVRAYAGEMVDLGLQFDALRQQTGQSVAAMMQQRQAAAALGTDTATLGAALTRLGDTIEGTGEDAARTRAMLADMGVSLDGLTRSQAPEALARIAERMQQYGPSAERATIANKLLGDGIGTELLPALDRGGAAMRAAAGEAERYGLRLSDAQVAAYRRMAERQAQAERENRAYAERVGIIWGDLAAKFSDIGAAQIGALDKLSHGWNAVLTAMGERAQAWWDTLPEFLRNLLSPGAITGAMSSLTVTMPPLQVSVPGQTAPGGASATAVDYLTNGTQAAGSATRVLAEEQRRMFEAAKAGIADINKGYEEKIRLAGLDVTQQQVIAARERARAEVLALFPNLTKEQAKELEPLIKQTEALAEREIRTAEARKKAQEAAEKANKLLISQGDDLVRATDAQAKAIVKANDGVESQIRKLEAAAVAAGGLTTEQRVQQAIIEAQNQLVDAQGQKIRDLTEAERTRIDAAIRLKETSEAQKKAIEDQQRATEKMTDDVVRYGADRFADLFSANRKGWREMVADMGSSAMAMFARLAFEAAARPIVLPVVTSVVGMMSGGAAAASPVAGVASSGSSSFMSSIVSPTNFLPTNFLNPFGNNFFGVAGGLSEIMTPGAGWLASALPSLFAAPVTGLTSGAAASLGIGAAEAASLSAGGALAGMSGLLSVGLPIAAAIALPMLMGLFGDDQRPVGNAQFEAIRNGRLFVGNGGVTSLDGGDTSVPMQMRANTAEAVNRMATAYGLTINKDLFQPDYDPRFAGFGNTSNIDLFRSPEDYIKALFGADSAKYGVGVEADRPQVRAALDRLRAGNWKPDTVDDINQGLAVAFDFDRNRSLAAAGGTGTREGQRLSQRYAAEDAAKQQGEAFTTYLEKVTKVFGEGSAQATSAATSVRQQALASLGIGPEGGGAGLTGRGAEIVAIQERIAAAAPALKAAGLTDAEIAAAQTQARDKALDPYKKSLADQMALANAGGTTTRAGQAVALRMAAEARAQTYADSAKEMIGTAETLYGAGSDQAKAAQAAAKNQVLSSYGIGPKGDGEALTGMAAAIAAVQAEAKAAEPALKAAGLTTEEVAKAMQQIESSGVSKLKDQFVKEMDKGLKQLTDPEGAARDAMQAQVDAIMADAKALNDPQAMQKAKQYTDQIVANFEQAAAAAQQAAQNSQVAATVGGATSVAVARQQAATAAAQNALGTASQAVAQAQSDLSAAQSAVQQQIGAAAQAAQAWAATADRLASARRDLALSELSPLSEAEKLAEARARVGVLRAQATSGGTDAATQAAMDALPDAIRTFLQLDRLFNSGSDNATYGRDFAEMQDLLRDTETTAGRQARLQQQMVDMLQAQLPGIGTNVKSIADATAALAGAQAAEAAAKANASTAATTSNAALKSQFETLATQALGYYNDAVPKIGAKLAGDNMEARYGAARDQILGAITDWHIINELGEKYYKGAVGSPAADSMRVKIIQLGGVPTFADGGLVAGGIPGMDSVLAGLMPGERVLTVEQTRIFDRLAARVVNDNVQPDLAPVVKALGGLGPVFRGALIGTEGLLSRLLAEVVKLNGQVAQQQRDLAALGQTRGDLYGRDIARSKR
ncbi:MAG: hypothetical protein J0H82_04565 [Alphaproteobacteria bacterium]|jgi:hypothetical protein|nr:hypothetical protein [Alphaproteobacteria bacterium]